LGKAGKELETIKEKQSEKRKIETITEEEEIKKESSRVKE